MCYVNDVQLFDAVTSFKYMRWNECRFCCSNCFYYLKLLPLCDVECISVRFFSQLSTQRFVFNVFLRVVTVLFFHLLRYTLIYLRVASGHSLWFSQIFEMHWFPDRMGRLFWAGNLLLVSYPFSFNKPLSHLKNQSKHIV